MKRAYSTNLILAAPLLLAAACQLPNPAFDGRTTGTDSVGTDDGDPSTSAEASTTAPDTGDGDGDPTTTTTTTGDGDGDGDTSTDAPDEGPTEDFPSNMCNLELRPGLEPTFLNPSLFGEPCPFEFGIHVKVYETDPGFWQVGLCEGGCGECNEEPLHPLGAPGLDLASLLVAPAISLDQPWVACYWVEAEELLWEEQNSCVYGAISIHPDDGPQAKPLFVANRDDWGLTWAAEQSLAGWELPLLPVAECECAELDGNVDCCDPGTVETFKFEVGPNGVYPGDNGPAHINGTDYKFYAQQAQIGAACNIVDVETSWALVQVN